MRILAIEHFPLYRFDTPYQIAGLGAIRQHLGSHHHRRDDAWHAAGLTVQYRKLPARIGQQVSKSLFAPTSFTPRHRKWTRARQRIRVCRYCRCDETARRNDHGGNLFSGPSLEN
jgi:hypothetical protein